MSPSRHYVEALYKSYLKMIILKLGNSTTDSAELGRLGSHLFGTAFRGVFPADKIPTNLKSGDMAIVNLDKADKPGSHWVALYRSESQSGRGAQPQPQKELIVYDSFGRKHGEILPGLAKQFVKLKITNTEKDREQKDVFYGDSKTELNCGARCVAWLATARSVGGTLAKLV